MEGDWDQWMADDPEEVEDLFLEEPDLATYDETDLYDELNSESLDEWLGEEDQRDARPPGAAIEPGKPPERPRPLRSPFVYHLTSLTNFEIASATAPLWFCTVPKPASCAACSNSATFFLYHAVLW